MENEVGKKQTFAIFLVVFIIALLIGFGIGFLLFYTGGSNDNKNTNTTGDNTGKKEVVSLSEEEVDKLLASLPEIRLSDENFNVYQNTKVSATDLKPRVLLAEGVEGTARELRQECTKEEFQANGICDYSLKVSDVKNTIKKLYNVDVETIKEFNGSGLLKCTLVKENYACSFTGGGWVISPMGEYFDILQTYFTEFVKSEKDDNYLYVYVKYAGYQFDGENVSDTSDESISNDPSNYKFKLYKYSNTSEALVDGYLNGKDFYDVNATFKKKLFSYLGDKAPQFVNVYKINQDGSYTWVYTEPVK